MHHTQIHQRELEFNTDGNRRKIFASDSQLYSRGMVQYTEIAKSKYNRSTRILPPALNVSFTFAAILKNRIAIQTGRACH